MTLAELRALINTWTKRNKTSAELDVLINMAMHNLEDEYNFRQMKKQTTGTLSSVDYISIPSDYKCSFCFILTDVYTTDSLVFLEKSDYKQMFMDYSLGQNFTTIPAVYATDEANNRFIFRPYPDTDYDYEFNYYGYSTDLSDANPSNFWITTNLWDLLFFATLLLYEPYIKNMPTPEFNDIAVWKALYDNRLAKVLRSDVDEQIKGSYRSKRPQVVV